MLERTSLEASVDHLFLCVCVEERRGAADCLKDTKEMSRLSVPDSLKIEANSSNMIYKVSRPIVMARSSSLPWQSLVQAVAKELDDE